MRPKNKIIIMLVEGHSDVEALRSIISTLFDEYYNGLFNVEFIEEKEDVTARKGISPRCIEQWISLNYLIPFINKNFLDSEDIHHIIQITDLDGVYIQDKHIIEEASASSLVYSADCIKAKNKKDVIRRNSNKRNNLDFLSGLSKIKLSLPNFQTMEIPYSIFYFGTNLDHFLYGNANLEGSKKISSATNFSIHTSSTDFEQKFLEAGEFYPFSCSGKNYSDSWRYVKEEKNSLSRVSNINLLLERIQNGYFIGGF